MIKEPEPLIIEFNWRENPRPFYNERKNTQIIYFVFPDRSFEWTACRKDATIQSKIDQFDDYKERKFWLNHSYLISGGVILNPQFTFGFYEETLEKANFFIYCVQKPGSENLNKARQRVKELEQLLKEAKKKVEEAEYHEKVEIRSFEHTGYLKRWMPNLKRIKVDEKKDE